MMAQEAEQCHNMVRDGKADPEAVQKGENVVNLDLRKESEVDREGESIAVVVPGVESTVEADQDIEKRVKVEVEVDLDIDEKVEVEVDLDTEEGAEVEAGLGIEGKVEVGPEIVMTPMKGIMNNISLKK